MFWAAQMQCSSAAAPTPSHSELGSGSAKPTSAAAAASTFARQLHVVTQSDRSVMTHDIRAVVECRTQRASTQAWSTKWFPVSSSPSRCAPACPLTGALPFGAAALCMRAAVLCCRSAVSAAAGLIAMARPRVKRSTPPHEQDMLKDRAPLPRRAALQGQQCSRNARVQQGQHTQHTATLATLLWLHVHPRTPCRDSAPLPCSHTAHAAARR